MGDLQELLQSGSPGALLQKWHESGKLSEFLPEVDRLFGVCQRAEHHPEIDTGIHICMCLDMAVRLNASLPARFAVLMHDLGKGLTPTHELPMHIDHEIRGLEPVNAVCERLQVPAYWKRLALLVCESHLHAHRAFVMRSKSMLKLLSESGLECDEELLEDFLAACEADKRGRLGKEEGSYLQGEYMRKAAKALQGLPMAAGTPILDKASHELYTARLAAVRNAGLRYRDGLEEAKQLC